MKLFADLERKRKQLEQKASDEAARKRETELAAEEKRNAEKEFAKNWEDSRQGRVNSWLNFASGKAPPPVAAASASVASTSSGAPSHQHVSKVIIPHVTEEKKKKKKEKRFSPMGFRPPKHKPESR